MKFQTKSFELNKVRYISLAVSSKTFLKLLHLVIVQTIIFSKNTGKQGHKSSIFVNIQDLYDYSIQE